MSRSGNPNSRRSMSPEGRYCNSKSVCNSHICVKWVDTVKKCATFIPVIKQIRNFVVYA